MNRINAVWALSVAVAFAAGAMLGDSSARDEAAAMVETANVAVEQANIALDQAIESLREANRALTAVNEAMTARDVATWESGDPADAPIILGYDSETDSITVDDLASVTDQLIKGSDL